MTPRALLAAISLLGWTDRGFSRAVQRPYSTVRGWLAGRSPVPGPIAAWLERRVQQWRDDPPPPPAPRRQRGPVIVHRPAREAISTRARQLYDAHAANMPAALAQFSDLPAERRVAWLERAAAQLVTEGAAKTAKDSIPCAMCGGSGSMGQRDCIPCEGTGQAPAMPEMEGGA